jgi:hypothetical protein
MYVSPVDAWIPDFIARNSINSFFFDRKSGGNVTSNGDALWYTGGNIRTSCNIEIKNFYLGKMVIGFWKIQLLRKE